MRIGEFAVEIMHADGTRPHETPEGHVAMVHGRQYHIRIVNDSQDRTNLYIRVDGLSVGNFQIGRHCSASLERPVDGRGIFTFFESGTSGSVTSGEAHVDGRDKGLVEVVFVPEVRRLSGGLGLRDTSRMMGGESRGQHTNSSGAGRTTRGGPCGQSVSGQGMGAERGELTSGGIVGSMSPGITGMTGHSSQEFVLASQIVEDVARKMVITLRLVGTSGYVAWSGGGPEPLPGRRGNPVPMPVW